MSVEAVRKDSIYEYLSPLSHVQGQHMMDKFDGDVLNSDRWVTFNIIGANTFAMRDAINGGFQITTPAVIGNRGGIDFDNIRQYDPFSSTVIQYATAISGTGVIIAGGLGVSNPDFGSSLSERSGYRRNTISGFYDQNNSDGSTSSSADTDVAVDLVQHRHQIYLANTSHYYTIDGVLKASLSTTLPNDPMQPTFMGWTNTANSATGSIQSCEAYNY